MAERPELSDAELEVLKRLWALGPSTVRAVHGAAAAGGRSWAYTTVQTLLNRLRDKGYAEAAAGGAGTALVYRAIASRDDLLRDRLDELADRYCEGAPAPLVLALVQGRRLPPEEVARLRALLDAHDAPEDPPSRGRRDR